MIAIAPNGARHTKSDHPMLPISPSELAITATSCLEAGATMIHLHVRDESGNHTLEPKHYQPAIKAIKDSVGDKMLIQVTSEAAGVYKTEEQIRLIREVEPEGVSIAIKEFFIDDSYTDASSKFLWDLGKNRCLIQYILYSPEDVRRYKQYLSNGVLPNSKHNVLFVLGRYSEANTTRNNLMEFITALGDSVDWMVCAFGPSAIDVLVQAAALGGHIRVGFENGWSLPDGQKATNNASLVGNLVGQLHSQGKLVANKEQATVLFRKAL